MRKTLALYCIVMAFGITLEACGGVTRKGGGGSGESQEPRGGSGAQRYTCASCGGDYAAAGSCATCGAALKTK